MSRRTLINDLVANGYEPGVLAELNLGELCILTQEEFVENTWSPAARAAAIAARHGKAGLSQRGRNSLAKSQRTMRNLHQKMGLKGKSLRFRNKQAFAKDKANLKAFER